MGKKLSINKNNHSNRYRANKEFEIKTEKEPKKILNLKEKMIKKIQEKRKNELHEFLFSNVSKENILIKNKIDSYDDIKSNTNPILGLTTKFNYKGPEINSNLALISKDILIVLTNQIYNEINGYSLTFEIKDLNIKSNFGNSNEFDINNYIIENDGNKNIISIIKLINKEILFNQFFEIDSNIDSLSEEKYIIDEKTEEVNIGVSISNEVTSYKPGSPIFIKKNNKLYLVGIVDSENYYYIFNKKKLENIKEKVEIIEMKYKFCKIEKFDFKDYPINNNELNFIFQYYFINLVYLNLENNNITTEGMIGLQNKSLGKVEYLNLSNNKIKDEGLTYLNYFSNLRELILLNMNLSDNYFLYLETNTSFIRKINIIECDKSKLVMKSISKNFNKFKLPNLTTIKFVNDRFDIHLCLKILFSCYNIYSLLKELDLSNCGLTDNGVFRIKKNIDKIKNIQIINLENTLITSKFKKHLNFFKQKKIKIILDINKLTIPNREFYKVYLGGSTISGKSSYIEYCKNKLFQESSLSTIGNSYEILNPSFDQNIKIQLFDTARWGGKFDSLIPLYLKNADGVILLFDISVRKDFEDLNYCLSLIRNYLELEDFPVLLIANKIDLERQVEKKEIEQFQKDNGLIGYFETSCLEGTNIIESFDFMADYLIKKEKNDYNLQ